MSSHDELFVKAMTLHVVKGYLKNTLENKYNLHSKDVMEYATNLLSVIESELETNKQTYDEMTITTLD